MDRQSDLVRTVIMQTGCLEPCDPVVIDWLELGIGLLVASILIGVFYAEAFERGWLPPLAPPDE